MSAGQGSTIVLKALSTISEGSSSYFRSFFFLLTTPLGVVEASSVVLEAYFACRDPSWVAFESSPPVFEACSVSSARLLNVSEPWQSLKRLCLDLM